MECVMYPFGEGNGTPLQCSCLENPMDRGAWKAAVHGVVKSWTRLSDFTFTSYFCALEKEMATHSSVPAWRIPGMGEPGGLPSMGSHRARHDWRDLAAAAAAAIPHRWAAQVISQSSPLGMITITKVERWGLKSQKLMQHKFKINSSWLQGLRYMSPIYMIRG